MIQKWMRKARRKKDGFTLIELIVVVAILGILAGVLIPTVSNVVGDARKSAGKSDAQAAFMAAQLKANDAQQATALAECSGSAAASFSTDVEAIEGSSYWKSFPSSTDITDLVVDSNGNVTSITISSKNGTGLVYPAAAS